MTAQTFTVPNRELTVHQFHAEASATSAGILTISVRSPAASDFADVSGTMDLSNSPVVKTFVAAADQIQVTASNVGATAYTMYVTSWRDR